jgi:NAD(P)-dependent dehydrogenase (short-subunit alcohol dehydrogenase family)
MLPPSWRRAAAAGRGSLLTIHLKLDFSVKSFAAAMQPNIWALVNNAGIAFKGDAFDENVARTTFSCNYHGTVRITSALLPLLVPGGHVINLSSRAGLLKLVSPALQQRFLAPDLSTDALTALCEEFCSSVADGTFASKGWSKTCYGSSKIAMSAYSRVCARLNPTLRINAICPGWCKTDMAGQLNCSTRAAFFCI